MTRSRIDRFYVSGGGWWIDDIPSVGHRLLSALFDHHMVTLHLHWNKEGPPEPRQDFFRLSRHLLKSESVREEFISQWAIWIDEVESPFYTITPSQRWSRLMTRVRQFFKVKARGATTENQREGALLREALEHSSSRAQMEDDEELDEIWQRDRVRLAEWERESAYRTIHLRELRFLREGDAPTGYTFRLQGHR